ncbi:MAG: ATP-dependent DNA helicase UvrD2 [Actinomycetota bacterium]
MSDADALLEGLTDEQRDAVTTAASPLCIVAGAGSGKTRVLTRRIAWQSAEGAIDPRRVLALTFTRRAAAELRSRTRRLGIREDVAAGTFHAAALATLRRFWDHTGRSHPTLLDRRMAFLGKAHPKLDRSAVADLDAEIGWARARLVTPEAYAEAAEQARRRPPRGAAFVSKAYAEFQDAKRERRLIDFDDVLALCHATMQRESSFADAQRWRHRHLFVDEFQDVNPLQFAVLRSMIGPDSTLVVVGDPDQAIYGWNGADPRFLNDIDEHLPGIAVVHLRTNFRSTPEVLAAAGRVLDKEPQPAHRFHGDAPTVTTTDLDDEPAIVARQVRARRKSGAPWRHQAVLTRTNGQLPALRAALEAAGIPTRSRGEGALLRRPEIMDLVETWPAKGALSTVLFDHEDPTHEGSLDPERAAMVEAFLSIARDHLALEADATVEEFIAALRHDDRVGATGDAVELSTFHAAKGLEWPIVHLAGLEDGLVPVAFARSKAALAEEQRLLYVAATRAERELHVTWSSARTIGETIHQRAPSPWLDAFVDPDGSAVVEPDLGELRERVGDRPPDIDLTDLVTPIVDELAAWREHAAHKAKVRPTAVLSDDALQRIAEARPATLDELASVPGVGPGKARRFGPRLLEISSPAD